MSTTAEAEAPHGLAFAVLGPLQLSYAGRPITLGSRKQRMLLACLLVAPDTVVSLAELAEVLWAGAAPASAELTLRSLASRLRAALTPDAVNSSVAPECGEIARHRPRGEELLLGRHGGYLLRVAPQVTDRARFEQHLARARAATGAGQPAVVIKELEAGLSLWRGRAFEEIADTGIAEVAAAGLERARVEAVEELGHAQLGAGHPAQALATLEPHLAAHPFSERGWEDLMLALYRLGRQAEALNAYQRVRQRLREELGVEPSPSLRRLQRRILLHHADLDLATVRTDPMGPRAGSAAAPLPAALTPLVGRAGELAELTELLGRTRLLTLTGVGGVGKTRLALALAATAASDTPDRTPFASGARLVELGAVDDPRLVLAQAAATFGVPTAGAKTEKSLHQRLVDFLAEQQHLVVLDNCEHVLAPAAHLVEALLTRCPGLTVVATSREPLGVAGELVYPVPSLSVPPPDSSDPRDLAGSGAAELFCQRANTAQVGFGATNDNVSAIAAICRRLDGIPLALELAAGKLRAMSAEDIANRLDDRFRLLTGGARTALPRQQTLRAALDWSFGLLSARERTLLCQLSVFPGTFDLAAAEAVGAPTGRGTRDELAAVREESHTPEHGQRGRHDQDGERDIPSVAELLPRLVDKSLIDVRRSGDSVRYRILETVKAYCLEQTHLAPHIQQAQRHHLAHYVDLAQAQRAEDRANGLVDGWLHHCLVEDHNYRAAIAHALTDQNPDAAILLLSALWVAWLWTGRGENVIEWFGRALAGPVEDGTAQVEALNGLAVLSASWELASPQQLEQNFARARAAAEAADDPVEFGRWQFYYSDFLLLRGQRAEAKKGLLAAERHTEYGLRGWCHLNLGWIAVGEADLDEARGRFQSAVELGRYTSMLVPHALASLAPLTALAGESERAQELAKQAIKSAEQLPLLGVSAMALLRGAQTQLLCGNHRDAAITLAQLFGVLHRLAGRGFQAEAFDAAAVLATHHGDHTRVARYFGVSTQIRATRAEDNSGVDMLNVLVHQAKSAGAAVLGRQSYAAAEQAGRGMTPAQALAEARDFCGKVGVVSG